MRSPFRLVLVLACAALLCPLVATAQTPGSLTLSVTRPGTGQITVGVLDALLASKLDAAAPVALQTDLAAEAATRTTAITNAIVTAQAALAIESKARADGDTAASSAAQMALAVEAAARVAGDAASAPLTALAAEVATARANEVALSASAIPLSALGQPAGPAQLDGGGTLSSVLAYVPTTTLKVTIARLFDQRFYQPQWWGAVGDGTTDDTTAIQAALTAANGRALVWLRPTAASYRTSGLVLATGDHLLIDGTLKLLDAAAHDTIKAIGVSNITIEGGGTIDGDKAASGGTAQAPIACINLLNFQNAWVRGTGGVLKLTNCTNWPINAWSSVPATPSKNAVFSDLEITASGNSTECASVAHCYADRLYMHDTQDYCWSFYGNVTDGQISNSTAARCGSGGFNALDDGGQKLPDIDITFVNNQAYGNNGSGFSVYNTNGAYPQHQNVLYVGNKSYNNSLNNQANYGGFTIAGCQRCSYIGNISHNNGNGSNSSAGFFMDGHNIDTLLEGNTSFDEGIGGGLGVGFAVSGSDNRTHIIGNYAYDDQTTRTMAFAFNGTLQPNGRSFVFGNTAGPTIGAGFNWTVGYDTPSCNVDYGGLMKCSGLVTTSATPDASGVRTVLAGTAYTVPAGTDLVRLTQTATIASQVIALPTAISDGQPLQIDNYSGAITALTFSPSVQGWIAGSGLAAYAAMRLRWDAPAAVWVREQ